MFADQHSLLNIVHCSLNFVLSPQTKTNVTLLEVRVTLTQTASTRMVPFSVNAMQDLLAMDSVAKEVGSGLNETKGCHSFWVVSISLFLTLNAYLDVFI